MEKEREKEREKAEKGKRRPRFSILSCNPL
jgi:hypothetical protein